MELPERVGILSLPNAILFPQALLPLYIFEPRYRLMLEKCLEGQRMFAIALCDTASRPLRVGSVGLVRACVHNEDGTANLVLQGLARVRFTEFTQKEPYFEAKIQPLVAEPVDGVEVDALVAKIVEIISQAHTKGQKVPEWMMKFMDELRDYDILSDLITYTFIDDVPTKQAILEDLDIRSRLHRVLLALRGQSTDLGFQFE